MKEQIIGKIGALRFAAPFLISGVCATSFFVEKRLNMSKKQYNNLTLFLPFGINNKEYSKEKI